MKQPKIYKTFRGWYVFHTDPLRNMVFDSWAKAFAYVVYHSVKYDLSNPPRKT